MLYCRGLQHISDCVLRSFNAVSYLVGRNGGFGGADDLLLEEFAFRRAERAAQRRLINASLPPHRLFDGHLKVCHSVVLVTDNLRLPWLLVRERDEGFDEE